MKGKSLRTRLLERDPDEFDNEKGLEQLLSFVEVFDEEKELQLVERIDKFHKKLSRFADESLR